MYVLRFVYPRTYQCLQKNESTLIYSSKPELEQLPHRSGRPGQLHLGRLDPAATIEGSTEPLNLRGREAIWSPKFQILQDERKRPQKLSLHGG